MVDSCFDGFRVRDRALFKDLNEAFNTDVGKANRSQTRVEGRGTARSGLLDSKGRMCELELKLAFWVPTYTRNLISVKKLVQQGAMVSFGKKATSGHKTGPAFLWFVPGMNYTLFVFFLLCVTLDYVHSQWNVSQKMHMEVESARDCHPGWATMQPEAESLCSGTGHWDTTTSFTWHGYRS